MNILFGKEQADLLRDRYVVLETDTIVCGDRTITTFCALDDVPIESMQDLQKLTVKHHAMMASYKAAKWNECRELIAEIDSALGPTMQDFYRLFSLRLDMLEKTDVPKDWTGALNTVDMRRFIPASTESN